MPIMIKQSCITLGLCQKAGPLVFTKKLAEIPTAKRKKKKENCHNPNDITTQPQHCSWVGHKNDYAHSPRPPKKLNGGLQEPQINIY